MRYKVLPALFMIGAATILISCGDISLGQLLEKQASGELGITPRHAPLITQLQPGPVRVQDVDGEEKFFFVTGGILEVQPHMVTVMADTALRGEDLDAAAAKVLSSRGAPARLDLEGLEDPLAAARRRLEPRDDGLVAAWGQLDAVDAAVVGVEPENFTARGGEQPGEGAAEGGRPGVDHVQGAGGVGADELHLDFVPTAHIGGAVAAVGGMDGFQNRAPGRGGHEKIDEARSRDLDLVYMRVFGQCLDQVTRKFARLPAGILGQHHRNVRGEVAVRCVTSVDAMTADWAKLPHEFLAHVSNRIVNEIRGINRVVYDISSKPPSTIEWE